MKLDREYERFPGGPLKPFSERFHVTLSSSGQLYLNRNAHKLLGNPDAVYIYFNRQKDEIAVEPTSPRLAQAFPVKHASGKSIGRIVQINPVMKHYGIRLEGTNRFIQPEIDQHGIMHLKLSEIVQIAGRKRRKS